MQLIKSPSINNKDQAVIYEVNLTIDNQVVDEFDAWLQKHVDEMLAIPGFISASTSVIENNDEETKQRCVQYRLVNHKALDTYFENDAERMRADGLKKFPGKMTAERRILTPSQAVLSESAICANCGTQLEGRFCSSCGQREEPRVPTFMSMLKEITNAMFGIESKLWKSIVALFFMPGHLTKTYLSGQRQKYTTPFRLYLLFSIITFAMVAFFGSRALSGVNAENGSNILQAKYDEISKEIEEGSQVDNSNQDKNSPDKIENNNGTISDTKVANADNKQRKSIDEIIEDMEINIGPLPAELNSRLENEIKHSLKGLKTDFESGDADALVSKFIQPLPKALLIFLPFIALAFKILYLGRGKYYIEHLVYLLHNHAFLFVLLIFTIAMTQFVDLYEYLKYPTAVLCNLVLIYFAAQFFVAKIKKNYPAHKFKFVFYVLFFTAVVLGIYNFTKSASFGSTIVLLWIFYAPYYVYRSMRVVYKSSRFVTVISYGVIFVTYLTLFAVTAVLYILFSGLTYA